jgi:nucleoid DNA-binding protein
MAHAVPKKTLSSADLIAALAKATNLTAAQIEDLFDRLGALLKKQMKGPKRFELNVAGFLKIIRRHVPARRARKAINPFKPGQFITVAGKPARSTLKLRPLKKLKDRLL